MIALREFLIPWLASARNKIGQRQSADPQSADREQLAARHPVAQPTRPAENGKHWFVLGNWKAGSWQVRKSANATTGANRGGKVRFIDSTV